MTQPAGSNVPIPYLAPWVSNWNKYSTQLYKVSLNGATSALITVPAGQWWRVIYCSAQFGTSATAGTRVVKMTFNDGVSQALQLAPSASTPISTSTFVTYGLGLNTVATPIQNSDQFLTVALVDLLWKPKTQISIGLDTAQSGDSIVASPALAVEIYTEYTPPASAPVLIPSPVLT